MQIRQPSLELESMDIDKRGMTLTRISERTQTSPLCFLKVESWITEETSKREERTASQKGLKSEVWSNYLGSFHLFPRKV